MRAGDHCERRISKHMLPLLFILGWYIFVVNATWNRMSLPSPCTIILLIHVEWKLHHLYMYLHFTDSNNKITINWKKKECQRTIITYFWWLKWIVCRKVNRQEKHSILVGTVVLQESTIMRGGTKVLQRKTHCWNRDTCSLTLSWCTLLKSPTPTLRSRLFPQYKCQ